MKKEDKNHFFQRIGEAVRYVLTGKFPLNNKAEKIIEDYLKKADTIEFGNTKENIKNMYDFYWKISPFLSNDFQHYLSNQSTLSKELLDQFEQYRKHKDKS